MRLLIALATAVAIAAPAAEACLVPQSNGPSPYWNEQRPNIAPGEVALRVIFDSETAVAVEKDPPPPVPPDRVIVTSGCPGPSRGLFRVTDASSDLLGREIIVIGRYDLPRIGEQGILIGQLEPATPAPLLIPRLPGQTR